MDFALTEEQEILLESLEEFLLGCGFDENYFRECYDNDKIPVEYNQAVIDSGLGLLGVPESLGGTEADVLTQTMVYEKITALGFPVVGSAMQLEYMHAFGNEKQLKTVSEIIMKGEIAFSLGITEGQAGADISAISTTAVRRNGKVYLNGHKSFVVYGLEAPYILCVARDLGSELPPEQALAIWLVPSNTPGVKILPMATVGCKMGSLCEIYFEDVELAEQDMVGKAGQGFALMTKYYDFERLAFAATALGMSQCAYSDAAKYANQRVQFGQAIGKFQLIQEKITYMALKLENMRNMVYKVAWEKDNGLSISASADLAKIYCSQASFEVCDDAVQIFGGIGYTTDHRVSRFWGDARQNRIAVGI